jgi:hypothetical protein
MTKKKYMGEEYKCGRCMHCPCVRARNEVVVYVHCFLIVVSPVGLFLFFFFFLDYTWVGYGVAIYLNIFVLSLYNDFGGCSWWQYFSMLSVL